MCITSGDDNPHTYSGNSIIPGREAEVRRSLTVDVRQMYRDLDIIVALVEGGNFYEAAQLLGLLREAADLAGNDAGCLEDVTYTQMKDELRHAGLI